MKPGALLGGRRLIAIVALCTVSALAFDTNLARQILEQARAQFGADAATRTQQWLLFLEGATKLSEMEKLQTVNTFFNRIRNREDATNWGVSDYWATPIELLGKNAGDCEDFVFAKYISLRELGVADEKLRVLYVRAYLAKLHEVQSHMVLAYYPSPEADPLVLDNLISAIKPGHAREDLMPVYEFNGGALWLAKERETLGRLRGADVPPAWPTLRLRMLHLSPNKADQP